MENKGDGKADATPELQDGQEPDDYDGAWKMILERFFPWFIAFFFPQAYEEIDCEKGYEFLDKELQEVTGDAELGRRLVDKLVKVWLKSGAETWILIHIEVQGYVEAGFSERMFVYHYRLYDRYHAQIVSFAVLADQSPTWRPDRFGYGRWGCEISLQYPVSKLLDYGDRWEELETSDNPFAVVVMAHLKTQATRHDPEERSRSKLAIAKGLYHRGWSRDHVLAMLRFIDWLMTLPRSLEQSYRETIHRYEEEHEMPFISPIERLAKDEGIGEGLQEAILEMLGGKFGDAAAPIAERVNAIKDPTILKALAREAGRASSLEEFQRAIPEA